MGVIKNDMFKKGLNTRKNALFIIIRAFNNYMIFLRFD